MLVSKWVQGLYPWSGFDVSKFSRVLAAVKEWLPQKLGNGRGWGWGVLEPLSHFEVITFFCELMFFQK